MKAVAIMCVSLLASCVAGTKFNANDVSKLKVCKSTREDALKLFGDPYNTGMEGGMAKLTWTYASVSKGEILQLALDSDNKIVDIALNPSMGYRATNQCTKEGGTP